MHGKSPVFMGILFLVIISLKYHQQKTEEEFVGFVIMQPYDEKMRGVEVYRSVAGIFCVKLHYTADPDKDPLTPEGAKWFEKAPDGYPGGINSSGWRREMEIDWDAAGGELCFPQLEIYKSKIVVPPFTVPESWSLYGSFDYGHRNPSAFHVYAIDHDGDIWAVWEYYRSGQGYKAIAGFIRACPYYSRLSYLPIADPSIWARTQQVVGTDQNEMKSIAQLFFELPPNEQILFAPGKSGGDITVAEKINGDLWNVEELKNGKAPRFRIMATCPMLIWELGKLRYKDWSGTMQEQRNLQESIVDKDNHAFDNFKMFMTMFFMTPAQEKPKKYEELKTLDPASYAEWMAVDKMYSAYTKNPIGEFE
jgi:hypothetical protein